MNPAERVAARIGEILDRDAWTQREFADRFGERLGEPRSQPWLQKILDGDNHMRLEDLDHAAAVLGVPTAELVRAPEDYLVEVTPIELQVLRLYRQSSAEIQRHIDALIGAALSITPKIRQKHLAKDINLGKTTRIPQEVGGGEPGPVPSAPTSEEALRFAIDTAYDALARVATPRPEADRPADRSRLSTTKNHDAGA